MYFGETTHSVPSHVQYLVHSKIHARRNRYGRRSSRDHSSGIIDTPLLKSFYNNRKKVFLSERDKTT